VWKKTKVPENKPKALGGGTERPRTFHHGGHGKGGKTKREEEGGETPVLKNGVAWLKKKKTDQSRGRDLKKNIHPVATGRGKNGKKEGT